MNQLIITHLTSWSPLKLNIVIKRVLYIDTFKSIFQAIFVKYTGRFVCTVLVVSFNFHSKKYASFQIIPVGSI